MNTTDLLDELSTAVHRDAARSRGRRRVTTLAVVLAALVVGGVALAGTTDGWWGEVAAENESAGIQLDLSTTTTVASSADAVLSAVETNGGKGYCLSLFLHGSQGMGTSCTTRADSEYMTRADDAHWIAYGRILDDGAAALDLSGAGLAAHVPLARGGFFAFDIPRGRWAALDGRAGDIAILDGSGRTIRNACVFVGFAPGNDMAGDGTLGDKPGTCAALKPIVPDPQLDRAKRLVTLTLVHDQGYYKAGDTIALWSAPNRGGGLCWFLGAPVTPHHVGGASCGSAPAPSFSPSLGSALIGDHYGNLVQGFVDPALGAAKAELVGATGSLPVSLGDGAYLAELPDSPREGNGPGAIPGGPWRVVLYDAAGTEVASARLPPR